MNSNKGLVFAGAVALIAAGVDGRAMAAGFAPQEQSTEALGSSFAGVAAGAGGLSSMFWNPATMTDHPGWQSSWSLSGVLPYAKDTPSPATPTFPLGRPGDNIGAAVVPASYTTYQINENLWAGLAVTSPFAFTTANNRPSAAQLWGLTTSILSYDINPNLAFKLNDMFSFAAGLRVMYFSARESSAVAASPVAPVNLLTGASWGVGFTLGATIKPWQGTEIGLGYRSQIREDMTGNINGTLPAPFGPGVYRVSAPITLPDTASIGLRQAIGPQFTLLTGLQWTGWSSVKSLIVTSTGPIVPAGAVLTTQNLNYKDSWMVSAGGEYMWNSALKLRAGVAYETSPIDDSNRDVRLLDSDRVWLSVGASYKWSEKLQFDVSYSHIFFRSQNINIPATAVIPIPYIGTGQASGDVVSVGLTYRWDDPVKPVLTAKY